MEDDELEKQISAEWGNEEESRREEVCWTKIDL